MAVHKLTMQFSREWCMLGRLSFLILAAVSFLDNGLDMIRQGLTFWVGVRVTPRAVWSQHLTHATCNALSHTARPTPISPSPGSRPLPHPHLPPRCCSLAT